MPVYMFPGQGSQAGITEELYTSETKHIFDIGNAALRPELGYDITDKIFGNNKDELKRTDLAQPAILLTSLAKYHLWSRKGLDFEVGVGDSFGEYALLVAAQAMELDDAARLVYRRGKHMRECRPEGEEPDDKYSFMMAVMNTKERVVRKACRQVPYDCGIAEISKVNALSQIVIAGNIPAVRHATDYLVQYGVKEKYILPLQVDAPFHCSLMLPAEYMIQEYLDEVKIKKPTKKIIMTFSGNVEDNPEIIKKNLVKQTSRTVNLHNTFESLINWGKRVFVESGPGKVLTKLLKRRKDVKVIED